MTEQRGARAADSDAEAEDIDLDLDAEDAALREAIGAPIRVRITGKVICFPNQVAWNLEATRFFGVGAYDSWAEAILSAADYKVWQAADMKIYQVDKIVQKILASMGLTPGKSKQPSRQRGGTRKS